MEMKDITKAIKEESKDTLKAMLSEAVKDIVRESIDKDDDDDMEIFDAEEECPECGEKECKCGKKGADGKCDKKSCKKESGELEEDGEEELPADDPAAAQAQAQPQQAQQQDPAMNAPVQDDGYAQQQDDFSAQYQAGDTDTLDLTGEQDIENVLKVYRSLSDDDQVVVTKDGNKINLQDNGTGAEYIIDLGMGDAEAVPQDMEDGGEAEQLAEEFEISSDDPADEEENNDLDVPEEMNEETLFEIDLGYTDNYQDKDPIDGLSNSEPSKSGRSWHKGIPTGTEKPWAGKGTEKKGDPFDNSVNENLTELDDDYFAAGLNDTGVAEVETEDGMPFDKKVGEVNEGGARTSVKKTHRVKSASNEGNPKIGVRRSPNSDNGKLEDGIEVNEAIKKLKAKNKKLNEAVQELHKGLKEAYMTNVNLGKITKLFLENTTTQAEKLNIVERFSNEAKTPKQAQALYESISKQLSKSKAPMTEAVVTEKKDTVNESKTYKSQDLLNTIDLMNRVINLENSKTKES